MQRLAHGKCVYCESKLGKTTYVEIEHYTAKTVAPELAFEWTNLFPACRLCNQKKGEQDHGGLLLKPDVEDPEAYFWINPDSGELQPHPRLDSDEPRKRRALATMEICDLQRESLCASRVERMTEIRLLANLPTSGSLTMEVREFLLDSEREYKFVIRHVLEQLGYEELAQEDRRRFEAPPLP